MHVSFATRLRASSARNQVVPREEIQVGLCGASVEGESNAGSVRGLSYDGQIASATVLGNLQPWARAEFAATTVFVLIVKFGCACFSEHGSTGRRDMVSKCLSPPLVGCRNGCGTLKGVEKVALAIELSESITIYSQGRKADKWEWNRNSPLSPRSAAGGILEETQAQSGVLFQMTLIGWSEGSSQIPKTVQ